MEVVGGKKRVNISHVIPWNLLSVSKFPGRISQVMDLQLYQIYCRRANRKNKDY